jgi:hypothetical protein
VLYQTQLFGVEIKVANFSNILVTATTLLNFQNLTTIIKVLILADLTITDNQLYLITVKLTFAQFILCILILFVRINNYIILQTTQYFYLPSNTIPNVLFLIWKGPGILFQAILDAFLINAHPLITAGIWMWFSLKIIKMQKLLFLLWMIQTFLLKARSNQFPSLHPI